MENVNLTSLLRLCDTLRETNIGRILQFAGYFDVAREAAVEGLSACTRAHLSADSISQAANTICNPYSQITLLLN